MESDNFQLPSIVYAHSAGPDSWFYCVGVIPNKEKKFVGLGTDEGDVLIIKRDGKYASFSLQHDAKGWYYHQVNMKAVHSFVDNNKTLVFSSDGQDIKCFELPDEIFNRTEYFKISEPLLKFENSSEIHQLDSMYLGSEILLIGASKTQIKFWSLKKVSSPVLVIESESTDFKVVEFGLDKYLVLQNITGNIILFKISNTFELVKQTLKLGENLLISKKFDVMKTSDGKASLVAVDSNGQFYIFELHNINNSPKIINTNLINIDCVCISFYKKELIVWYGKEKKIGAVVLETGKIHEALLSSNQNENIIRILNVPYEKSEECEFWFHTFGEVTIFK